MLQKLAKGRLYLTPPLVTVHLLHLPCPRLRTLPRLCHLEELQQEKELPQVPRRRQKKKKRNHTRQKKQTMRMPTRSWKKMMRIK